MNGFLATWKARATRALVAPLVLAGVVCTAPAGAQDLEFLSFGTGPTGSSYFPVGGFIANAISYPPGSRLCDKGGSCGVPGLIAVAQTTQGSLNNLDRMRAGTLRTALAQADHAYWSYHGTGPFAERGALTDLRAVARIFNQSIHIVTLADAPIDTVYDLEGVRLAVGPVESGPTAEQQLLFGAYGLDPEAVELVYMKPGPAADALAAGEIDAMMVLGGAPMPLISRLSQRLDIKLLPIVGGPAELLAEETPFFNPATIPAGAYTGMEFPVPTLDVGAVWVVSAALPEELVYGLTRAYWAPQTQTFLDENLPTRLRISPNEALANLGIPFHAGAAGYYFDSGMTDEAFETEADPAAVTGDAGETVVVIEEETVVEGPSPESLAVEQAAEAAAIAATEAAEAAEAAAIAATEAAEAAEEKADAALQVAEEAAEQAAETAAAGEALAEGVAAVEEEVLATHMTREAEDDDDDHDDDEDEDDHGGHPEMPAGWQWFPGDPRGR